MKEEKTLKKSQTPGLGENRLSFEAVNPTNI